ncbi:glycosyltransferase [Simiduia curdlanivorans]|uniref:Glycosyltransferase n=1 Tax=Simiduia curdlanivorans TaxID=1492769 RepID=A0ABV8V0Z1_9GAMM|nr:glycosyltransferase [Simiduia curdlanivorans]MDN3637922.1 glycosyltransferase [Simiduia curdlanivorans]
MKPIKILHCANFSELKNAETFYSIDRKLSNGLTRNGHFVYNFSYRDIAKSERKFFIKSIGKGAMQKRLITTLDNLQPDLLLLGHTELISENLLATIKLKHPNLKIAMWWVDWIHNLKHQASKIHYVDHFFITTDPIELKSLGIDDDTLKKCHYLPNLCDSSIDSFKAFENGKYSYDLLFIGRYDAERAPLLNHIQDKYSNYKLGIFGQNRESLVFGADFYRVLSNSKIALNYSRSNTLNKYSSDRLIQPVANGVLTLSAYFPGLETLFQTNEVPSFSNFDELDDLLERYLKDDEARRGVARAGHMRAHKDYETLSVSRAMLEIIYQEKLS